MNLSIIATCIVLLCVTGLAQAEYKYIGCYIDTGYRDLPHLVYAGSLTISTCYSKCKANNYSYFGLQYYSYCFCGNTYGLFGISDKSKCNLHCSGNRDQTCGGVWRNSIYSTGIVHTYPFKYLGCYEDQGKRDLPELGKVAAMSATLCYNTCKAKGYAYFGLQYTSYCFCGNSYGAYSKKPEKDCKMPCHGNKGQHCGGSWRNSLYATGLKPPTKPYVYRGCYLDSGVRDLKHLAKSDAGMTPDMCNKLCKDKGYKHFGVQYYTYCFCGNTFGRYGKRPEAECNTICRGDKGIYCGGTWRSNIYTIGGVSEVTVRTPTYIGCFKDAGYRDLPYHALTHRMTISRCNRECTARGFAYFGLQYAAYCFCGNSYGMYGEAARSQCGAHCDGNKEQTCGGTWRNSIYRTNYIPKFPYKYLGCYKDGGARDLPHNVATREMSIGKCYDRCKKAGYKYFGLQYTYYCFCGNSYGKYGTRPRRECNMVCDGNRGQHCGGVWRNSVYSVHGGEDTDNSTTGAGTSTSTNNSTNTGDRITSIDETEIQMTTNCIDPVDQSVHKNGTTWISPQSMVGMCYQYKCSGRATDLQPISTLCMDASGNCITASEDGTEFSCRGQKTDGQVCKCVLKDGDTYVLTIITETHEVEGK